jgi:hypothetical protein
MNPDPIPGGGFTMARKLFRSAIWLKDPLYLKIWIWIIGKASHSNHEKNGHKYGRGEFVTTHDEIVKAGMFVHNRKRTYPSTKKIRVILKWLEKEGMIRVEPLKSGLGRTGADPTAHTGAYIGVKITVINYGTYQDLENYKGRHQGGRTFEQGHNNNNGYKNGKNISAEIFSLRERYSDQKLIDQAFSAIASTRKTNRVADSVLLAQLQKWGKYPADQVEAAIRIYLDKDYASQGKREAYLMAIIRNNQTTPAMPSTTGSPLLDSHYAQQSNAS